MIILNGFAISNYYNKVKLALLEKEIPFQEVMVAPSQEESVLARSPLGKIPFIKTDEGYISESEAIIEYLEDAYPEHPLFPSTAFEKAKCREYIQHLEQNVELIARRIYGEALFSNPVSQEIKDEVLTKVEKGLVGLTRMIKMSPYVLGDTFSIADALTWPHLQLISYCTDKVYGRDLVAEHIPGITAYNTLIESRPHAQKVSVDRAAALAQFFAGK